MSETSGKTKPDQTGVSAPGQAESVWHRLAETLVQTEDGVAHGRMMSSPAVTYNGKVFAFYCDTDFLRGLGVRLGRDHDMAAEGLTEWQVLSPFKTKPPLKDWFVISPADRAHWARLARLALAAMRG